jgi:iron-sulfur cluster assembly protein
MEYNMSNETINVDTIEEIILTETAITEVQRLMDEEEEKGLYLRVGVTSGGCSGLSYSMGFDNQKQDIDKEFVFGPVRVVVDENALTHINGATLDFEKSMMGGGFSFNNPNAARSCGCGSSFTC